MIQGMRTKKMESGGSCKVAMPSKANSAEPLMCLQLETIYRKAGGGV